MKSLVLCASMFIAAVGFADADHSNHTVHAKHYHKHSSKCAHPTCNHEGHVDYNHKGHDHHVVKGVKTSEVHDCHIPLHDGHDHQHGKDCGHESRTTNGIAEYNHDGHWHHHHGDHTHEAHS